MARLLVRWPSILKVRNAFLFILRWQLVLFSVIVVQSLIFSGEPHFSCRGTLMVEKACINPLSPVADNHPPSHCHLSILMPSLCHHPIIVIMVLVFISI